MSELNQLYQDIILGHNKRPNNYGEPERFSGKTDKHNPLCGDEVTVYWKIEDNRITELSFTSQGCAISRASASMMTEVLQGKTLEEARTVYRSITQFLSGVDHASDLPEVLGDLAALSGVRDYPSRIKCATLAWEAFMENI